LDKYKGDYMKKAKYPPDEIRLLVNQWLGVSNDCITHWWEQDGTYFIVSFVVDAFFFLRVFSVGGSWRLSCDKDIHIDDLKKQ